MSQALYMQPDGRVAKVLSLTERGAIVAPAGGGDNRAQAFDWDELVELTEARELRRFPQAEIDTDWGAIRVTATGARLEKHWGRIFEKKVVVDCPPGPEERGLRLPRPIEINRVAYTFSGALARDVERGGAWEAVDHFHLYRQGDYSKGSTEAARRIAWDRLPKIVGAWLDRHPHFLEEALRVELSNQIAIAEGEVLAAKVRYEQAVEKRAALLGRER